ncbi:MAG: PEGA domain-containing protein [bacterium]
MSNIASVQFGGWLMFFLAIRTHLVTKVVALAALFVFAAVYVTPAPAAREEGGTDQTSGVYREFQEVITFRADGKYDSAIDKLSEIIKQYLDSDEVLKLAYNHLVQTYQEKGDLAGARRSAREALERFPDLTADEISFPPFVNDYYDELRKEMFGSLTILKPKGCRVFLNEVHVGETPLELDLVRVGEYDLTLTKSGYHDYADRIQIQPDLKLDKTVSLEAKKGFRWWAYRVGAGVVAASLLAVGLTGGDETEPPPEPLPGPPEPPSN